MKRDFRVGALGLLAWALAGCATNIPHAPSDVSAVEVERYRFGMYQECQAAGALRGEGAAAARAFCDCVDDVLTRNVSDETWRSLVFLNVSGQVREERLALAPMLGGVSLCRTVTPPAGATADVDPNLAVEGLWKWKRPFDGCTETFEFRANRTARFERGNERTENAYRMAAAAEPSGRYKVELVPSWFSSGVTCDGAFRDEAQRQAPVYVLFGPRFETLAVCDSAGGADCAGPLHREREAVRHAERP